MDGAVLAVLALKLSDGPGDRSRLGGPRAMTQRVYIIHAATPTVIYRDDELSALG